MGWARGGLAVFRRWGILRGPAASTYLGGEDGGRATHQGGFESLGISKDRARRLTRVRVERIVVGERT